MAFLVEYLKGHVQGSTPTTTAKAMSADDIKAILGEPTKKMDKNGQDLTKLDAATATKPAAAVSVQSADIVEGNDTLSNDNNKVRVDCMPFLCESGWCSSKSMRFRVGVVEIEIWLVNCILSQYNSQMLFTCILILF